MGKRIEYKCGERVGTARLTFVKEAERINPKIRRAVFECDCGAMITTTIAWVVHGRVNSCGCLKREFIVKKNTKHGQAVRKDHTGSYRSWAAMKQRCNDQNADGYYNYGGRGITVCERWNSSFENFFADMGERPKGCSIERVDTNGNYEPTNCVWATAKQQAENTRRNVLVTRDGKTCTISQRCESLGITYNRVKQRRQRGWSLERALFTPINVTKIPRRFR